MTDQVFIKRPTRVVLLAWAVVAVLVVGIVLSTTVFAGSNSPKKLTANPPGSTTVVVSGASHGDAAAHVHHFKLKVFGSSPTGLAPGVTRSVTISIHNHSKAVRARILTAWIQVHDASKRCHARGNITTTRYSSRRSTKRYITYYHHRVHIPVSITMLDTSTNQNACKGVKFPLTFHATAVHG